MENEMQDFSGNWAETNDNQNIYFEDTGRFDPVILFHSGFMGIHDIWKYQVEGLSHKYRLITHDRRGYGLSSSPDDEAYYSIEHNVADMKAVLDAAGVSSPVYLVTHSLGGTEAVAFSIKYPELVKGMILAGGAAISGDAGRAVGWDEDVFAKANKTPQDSLSFYHNFGLEKAIAIEAGKWCRHVFRHQTKAFLNYETDQRAKDIKVPVIVLHGSKDVVTPLSHAQEIVDTLPKARLEILEGVNHFPPTEAPERLNTLIEQFIQTNP